MAQVDAAAAGPPLFQLRLGLVIVAYMDRLLNRAALRIDEPGSLTTAAVARLRPSAFRALATAWAGAALELSAPRVPMT